MTPKQVSCKHKHIVLHVIKHKWMDKTKFWAQCQNPECRYLWEWPNECYSQINNEETEEQKIWKAFLRHATSLDF